MDTLGLLLVVLVTGANTQDRDGARPALARLRAMFDTISLVWADGAYSGGLVGWAKSALALRIQIVRRSDSATGFEAIPRRWVVERTLSWICRRRRCVRDYERPVAHRHGVGALLLRACLTEAASSGATFVWLATAKPDYFARYDFHPMSKWTLPPRVVLRKFRLVFEQPVRRWVPALLGRHTFMRLTVAPQPTPTTH